MKTLAARLRDQTFSLLRDCLVQVTDPAAEPRDTFFDGAEWQCPDSATTGVSTRLGPAGGWAALLRFAPECPGLALGDSEDAIVRRCLAAGDALLERHTLPDGCFVQSASPESVFCAIDLIAILEGLGERVDAARRARWTAALERHVDGLIEVGCLFDERHTNPLGRAWYTNGNIELDEMLLLELMRSLTGKDRYRVLFEEQYAFAMNPTKESDTWRGYDFTVTREPASPDGSDGAGFLPEAEGGVYGGPRGWDIDYGMFQTSIAAHLYLPGRDPRMLRLTNMLLNQELTRLDPATAMMDCRGGTRRSNRQPFWSFGLPLAAFLAGRAELRPLASVQLDLIDRSYRGYLAQGSLPGGLWRGFGCLLPEFLAIFAEAARNA